MRKSRFTEAQIMGMLKEQEAGLACCRAVPEAWAQPCEFCKLKAKYGGMDLSDARRLRQLEGENAKLKRLVADVMLDNVFCRTCWESPDDADATAGRGAAGDEGSPDLSAPGLRPDRCRSEDGAARADAR